MSLLDWIRVLLGGSRPPKRKPKASSRRRGSSTRNAPDFMDVLDGWRFTATLSFQTPVDVLHRHGELHRGNLRDAPSITTQEHGCWVPQTKSWSKLGIKGLRELPESESASQIGPVLATEYVPFLIEFAEIWNAELPYEQKIRSLGELPKKSANFREFWDRHRDLHPGFPEVLFVSELATVSGVSSTIAQRLWDIGIRSPGDVLNSSDEILLSVSGIGKKTLEKIRSR